MYSIMSDHLPRLSRCTNLLRCVAVAEPSGSVQSRKHSNIQKRDASQTAARGLATPSHDLNTQYATLTHSYFTSPPPHTSATLKSRHSPSTISFSPKPDLSEAREYFYTSLCDFLTRRHRLHFESFLSVAEAYAAARTHRERAALGSQILERFLTTGSSERLNVHPQELIFIRERFQTFAADRELPEDMFGVRSPCAPVR
jgi:hypothetical protein